MITALLLAALAQTATPEIRIDENGFVTVVETPEARARERQHLEMIVEAEQAYKEYQSNRTGDALAVIEKYERILESGMELNPRVHHNIALRLAELHRRYATLPTPEAEELQRRIQERLM
ncbi:MAG TPA: hypothetical protein ENN29_10705, partial [Candidatus Hydrogenedentes bacterium]|nr:hypothetical protein [Candidatus Hydrogenedentota bacterium]